MVKKVFFFFVVFMCFTGIAGYCATPTALIKDVRGEILDDAAQIVIEANCDIEYVDYTLENPPRLIIDPIGKVYSDLKDVITFDSGPVKKVIVVKAKSDEELSGNFYPLDFICIELSEAPIYKVKKEVKQSTLIVDIGHKKEVKVSKLIPLEEPAPEPPKEETPVAVVPLPVAPPSVQVKVVEEQQPAPIPLPEQQEPAPAAIPLPPQPPVSASNEIIPLDEPKKPDIASAAPGPIKLGYRIGEGDALDISVWQHPDIDKKVVVRPDGCISFPLVGDVKALGKTPAQLAADIKDGLARLIKNPEVTVVVAGFNSKTIFILGELNKPGSYPYRGGMTILDAISQGGGWRNSAVLNSVMVVRKAFTDAPEAHRLNVYALIKNGDFSQNLALEPGDIIYVPQSFVANIGAFIENLRISVGAYVTENTHLFT